MPYLRKRESKDLGKSLEVLCHLFIHSFGIDSANMFGENYCVPIPLLIVINIEHRRTQSQNMVSSVMGICTKYLCKISDQFCLEGLASQGRKPLSCL